MSAFTALTTLWVPLQFFSGSVVYPQAHAPIVVLLVSCWGNCSYFVLIAPVMA
jgi:hypothetical protein